MLKMQHKLNYKLLRKSGDALTLNIFFAAIDYSAEDYRYNDERLAKCKLSL